MKLSIEFNENQAESQKKGGGARLSLLLPLASLLFFMAGYLSERIWRLFFMSLCKAYLCSLSLETGEQDKKGEGGCTGGWEEFRWITVLLVTVPLPVFSLPLAFSLNRQKRTVSRPS